MPGGAIYAAQVSLLQGKITVPYTGMLSLLLVTGGNISLPVQGVYQGTTYAPAVSDVLESHPMQVTASLCRLLKEAGKLACSRDLRCEDSLPRCQSFRSCGCMAEGVEDGVRGE